MSQPVAQSLSIAVDGAGAVSALWLVPPRAQCCFVFAHGAGAGMTHEFMSAAASELAASGVATLRYQFPYMERGSKRTDPPAVCHATVRAAVAEAARLMPHCPLLAGGRSFGGRMTSQAQSQLALPGVRGLAFFGFPLHPARQPATARADHLQQVMIPMLFIQGTRDELAQLDLLEPLLAQLGEGTSLHVLHDADHSFHVPARTRRTDAAVRAEALGAFATWARRVAVQS